MFVSIKEFLTYALHISDDVKERDGRSHFAWIAFRLFNHCNPLKNLSNWKVIIFY